jgi:pyruvate formate lyase activating enzyme
MFIGGLQKFSLIDYPEKICAIVFTQGCNFRCDYCHNPELSDCKNFREIIPEKDIIDFLEKRKGKLDAVTVTGGEPTLQPDLVDFLRKIKKMGFLVKLDSNGSNPDILKRVIDKKLVDYIAMDVKAPLKKYKDIANFSVDPKRIKKSIEIIKKSGVDYEFRTTIVKSQISMDDFFEIGELVKGAKLYVLQKFIPTKLLNPEFINENSYSDEEFKEIKKIMESFVKKCTLR